MRVSVTAALFAIVACGPGSSPPSGPSNVVVSGTGSGANLPVCGALAADYSTALLEAMRCDPGAVDPCGAQYPLAVKACDASMNCRFEGLCWVAYVGYVDPARTSRLDDLIARYKDVGCSIGSCPGPGPHATHCTQNHDGVFTCGGQ